MTQRSPFRYFKTSPEIIDLAVVLYSLTGDAMPSNGLLLIRATRDVATLYAKLTRLSQFPNSALTAPWPR